MDENHKHKWSIASSGQVYLGTFCIGCGIPIEDSEED